MRGIIACLLLAVISLTAHAQTPTPWSMTKHDGNWNLQPATTGSGSWPVNTTWESRGASLSFGLERTHKQTYVTPGTTTLTAITGSPDIIGDSFSFPPGLWYEPFNGDQAILSVVMKEIMKRVVAGTHAYPNSPFGTFRVTMADLTNGEEVHFDFDITSDFQAEGSQGDYPDANGDGNPDTPADYGEGGGSTGGGSTGGDGGGDPSEEGWGSILSLDWWKNLMIFLFVPSEADFQVVKDSFAQFLDWGPFKLIADIATSLGTISAGAPGAEYDNYLIHLPGIPFFGNTIQADLDLRPYAAWFLMVRSILLGMLMIRIGPRFFKLYAGILSKS